MILCYFIFISLALGIHGIKLHKHMTPREIETTFNCDHKLVHEVEYEVTPILHVDQLDHRGERVRRSSSAVHFRAFDKDISLYLLENDNTLLGSNTPLFMAQRSRHARYSDQKPKVVYSKMRFPMPKNLKLYHDRKKRAAITVFTDEENKAHMHGVIEDEVLIVKPIPSRVHKEILPMYPELFQSSFSYKRPNPFSNDPLFSDPFSGDSLFGNFYEPTHHIVIKPNVQVNSADYNSVGGYWKHSNSRGHNKNNDENDLKSLFHNLNNLWKQPAWVSPAKASFHWSPATRRPLHLPTDRFPTHPSTGFPIPQRPTGGWPSKQTPGKPFKTISEQSDIVYPELLVSVDYETYEFHRHDIKELAKYMAAFWNAVDLRFRELSQPQVRLNIAGLIVPQTKDSAPYYRVASVDDENILDSETLNGVKEYFAEQSQLPKNMYDIVVAITRLDLGSYLSSGTFHKDSTSGIAYMKEACKVDSGDAVALVHDKGGFNGISVAAHELAHSMGAPHDGEESRDLPMGPCLWSDGYLMSYARKDSRGMHWSRCSKSAMREFFKSEQAQCLRNKPNVGIPYPKFLPGKSLSRDEQCRFTFGPGFTSSKEYESNCAILRCKVKIINEYRVVNEHNPPAEGSYCGDGAICLDAQCVKDPEIL